MKNINIKKAKRQLDKSNNILYFWIIFGIFLILWRVYYFYMGHVVRWWVTFLWIGIALWLMIYPSVAIPYYSKLHRKVLCKRYQIESDYLILENLSGEILKIPWRSIRMILLNWNRPNIVATGIFFMKDRMLYQIRVDEHAGKEISYYCLRWHMENMHEIECLIVRDISKAYKLLKILVPRRLDPLANIKPAKKVDEEKFKNYIKSHFWRDRNAIESMLKELEKKQGSMKKSSNIRR